MAVLFAAAAGFILLYLNLPAGWTPHFGFASNVRAAFERRWSYPTWSLSAQFFTWLSVLLLVTMWTAYLAAVAVFARVVAEAERKRVFRLLIAASVLIQSALLVLPPVLSKDLFHYALFGRMVTAYGLNPYVTAGNAIASDPLWAFASWRFLPTHYGPTFTWLSAGAAYLAGGSVIGTAIAFRVMAVLFGLLACWAAGGLVRESGGGDGRGAMALYALNPVVLIETASSGHNEAVMMGLCLAGLLAARRGFVTAGFLLLVASATVKYVTGAVVVLFFAHVVFHEMGWRARAGRAARLGAAGLLTVVILYAPFWKGMQGWSAVIDLVTRGRALHAGAPSGGEGNWFAITAFAALVVGAAILCARSAWPRVLEVSALLSLVFVLVVFDWKFPWYVLPALALAVAGERTRSNRMWLGASLWMGFLLMMLYARLVVGTPL